MDSEHRPDSVGYRISKAVDKKGGLRLKDLETPAGIDRGSLSKLLRGDRESTSLEVGLRLAAFLGVNPFDFLPETDRKAIAGFGGVLMAEPFCVTFSDGSKLDLNAKVTVPKDSSADSAATIVDKLEATIRATFQGPGVTITASRKLAMPLGGALTDADADTPQDQSHLPPGPMAEAVRKLQDQIDELRKDLTEAKAQGAA